MNHSFSWLAFSMTMSPASYFPTFYWSFKLMIYYTKVSFSFGAILDFRWAHLLFVDLKAVPANRWHRLLLRVRSACSASRGHYLYLNRPVWKCLCPVRNWVRTPPPPPIYISTLYSRRLKYCLESGKVLPECRSRFWRFVGFCVWFRSILLQPSCFKVLRNGACQH